MDFRAGAGRGGADVKAAQGMSRGQWLFVCITAAVAVVAYIKADAVSRLFSGAAYREPGQWNT